MGIPNFKNRTLFHGDNLVFLRGINSETVDLIATDPPFKKGRDFHATPDSLAAGAKFQDRWSWADDVEGEWVDQITDDWPKVMTVINAARESYGDDMGAFLCFMGVRLLEMQRVLKSTGSIYLHCDPTASHYLKTLLDSIFGMRSFRNEINWQRTGAHSDSHRYGAISDRLLFYTKSKVWTWNTLYTPYSEEYIKQRYRYDDGDGRLYWRNTMTAAGPGPARMFHDEMRDPPPGTHWRCSQIQIDKMETENRIYYSPSGMPYVKSYLDERKGRPLQDIWPDIVMSKSGKERTSYPTQKPVALYERIIEASSNPGDIVLDPFAGCATTSIAAEKLGRQWVGMDIWDGAYDVVVQRLNDNRQLLNDIPTEVSLVNVPPQRTDSGEATTPYLQVTEKYAEPGGTKMSRAEMYKYLLAQYGSKCQGCDRTFDDSRYLELDHNTPRSDGGLNHISNRILLCSPCNRAKSNTYTLSGLRKVNKKNNWMVKG